MLFEWLRTAAIAARNVVLGSNLASSRLATRPRALVAYNSEALFLLNAMQQHRGLPERHVLEALPQHGPVTLELSGHVDPLWFRTVGSYLSDLVGLCLLCRALRPRVVFEIGTFNGYSAFHFALNTPPDSVIYTLDLPPGGVELKLGATVVDLQHVREGVAAKSYAFTGTGVESKVHTLKGDSAIFDFSPWHRKVDLFFIDGAHSYEYVRSDTERALQCVRPGGAIAWHDFGRTGVNGVRRYLRELARTGLEINVLPGGSLAYVVGVHTYQLPP